MSSSPGATTKVRIVIQSSELLLDRTIKFVVLFIFAATFAISVANQIGPERNWCFSFLQYIPYYFFLAPALGAFALSFVVSLRWQLMSFSSVVLIMTIVMGLEINKGDAGTARLRLMTYNVKDYVALDGGASLGDIAREVALHDPDILGLQDAGLLNEKWDAEREKLAILYGNRHVYTFGQYAVASRYRLRGCEPGYISYRNRTHTYVHCVVLTPHMQIDLYTVHLLTPRDGLNAVRQTLLSGIVDWQQNVDDRMTQADSLAKDLHKSIRPVILLGDLNAPEKSLVVRRLLQTGLKDAFSTSGVGYGYTYGHSLKFGISFLRIDHILVSQSMGVENCFVGGKLASPHRPVIADVLLKPQ